jgi:hypothetical protein
MVVRQRDIEGFTHEGNRGESAFRPTREEAGGIGDHNVEVGRELGRIGHEPIEIVAVEGESGHPIDGGEKPGQEHLAARGKDRQGHFAAGLRAEIGPEGFRPLDRGRYVGRGASERSPGRCQSDPAPDSFGEWHTRFALEDLQLLRDSGWGPSSRESDRRDAAPIGKLAQ